MRIACRLLSLSFLAAALSAHCAVHYVSPLGNHSPPFSSWADAATNIQAAVDVATNGSLVLITNGTYTLKSEVVVTSGVTIAGFNGQEYSVVAGCSTAGCFKLMHSNAVLRALTIQGGRALYGAGVYIHDGGRVENCTVKHNSTSVYYGGQGGGIHVNVSGAILDCTVVSNVAYMGDGGGIYAKNAVTISNCVITHNSADYGGGGHAYGGLGGGIHLVNGGTVTCCAIEQNGGGKGGGLYCVNSLIERCRIVSNETWFSYDNQSAFGGGIRDNGSRIENCLIAHNTAGRDGGGIFGSGSGTIQNSTVVNNHDQYGNCGGVYNANLVNSIVWGNTAYTNDEPRNCSGGTIAYTCTTPMPGAGDGNITNAPLFADEAFRLDRESPCIDSGITNDAPTIDLDGVARPLDGNGDQVTAFDMGAYEFAASGVDSDGDGQSDYAEAIAGTDVTNPGRTFSARGESPMDGGYVIRWDAVVGRYYTLQKRTSLSGSWSIVSGYTNLPGAGMEMSYTNSSPEDMEFYTIKVRRQ